MVAAGTWLAAGCQPLAVMPGPEGQTRPAGKKDPAWPEGRLYQIDEAASEVRIVVYPAGPLARFGHPHVIGGEVLRGQVMVADPFEASALRLRIDVQALTVDRPEWRVDEGFDPEMPPSAIEDTRANMLSEALLDADRHPEIHIESIGLSGPAWQPDIDVRIELAGQQRELTVPVSLDFDESSLIATGRFSFHQSDFGITPFSAAGGNLQVADQVLVRFRIVTTQP